MFKTEITCPSCSYNISIFKGTSEYKCPVCGTAVNVRSEAAKEKMSNEGLISVIKYEGDNNTFVWKHPIEDFNIGSQLIVHESQEAIFFRDGQALDLFGAGRHTLETQNIPLLNNVYKFTTNADTIFHAEVYFINLTTQMAIKWGTPDKVRFIDPLTNTPLELGASGEMNVKVADSRKLLLKLVGTMTGISWDDREGFAKSLKNAFRPLIANAVKTNLAGVIKSEAFDLLEIDSHLDIISENLHKKITAGFEEYGLTISEFYVTNILLPDDDPNFKRIRELHTLSLQKKVIEAEADIKIAETESRTKYRTAEEQSKAAIEAARRGAVLEQQTTETEIAKMQAQRRIIAAQAEAQAERMSGMVEAEIMQAKGYNQKDIIQADVQKAYAESIGNMGPAISAGGGNSIVGDMLGLGVGITAAGAIAPQIGNMLQGIGGLNQTAQQTNTLETWDCTCGNKGIIGGFCNMCGAKKPEPQKTWDCSCGNKGIIGNFCNMCGAKKPETSDKWDCSCGNMGIVGNFCNICGKKKGE